MKNPKLGDYLLWKDQPAKIIGEIDQRTVIIEMLENHSCPECNRDLGKNQIHIVASSPLFQENAKPMPVIKSMKFANIHEEAEWNTFFKE